MAAGPADMRIIAGAWRRGRPIEAPAGRCTRPIPPTACAKPCSRSVRQLPRQLRGACGSPDCRGGALGLSAVSRRRPVEASWMSSALLRPQLRATRRGSDRGPRAARAARALLLPRPSYFVSHFADSPTRLGSGTAAATAVAAVAGLHGAGCMSVETSREDRVDPGPFAIDVERQIGRARLTWSAASRLRGRIDLVPQARLIAAAAAFPASFTASPARVRRRAFPGAAAAESVLGKRGQRRCRRTWLSRVGDQRTLEQLMKASPIPSPRLSSPPAEPAVCRSLRHCQPGAGPALRLRAAAQKRACRLLPWPSRPVSCPSVSKCSTHATHAGIRERNGKAARIGAKFIVESLPNIRARRQHDRHRLRVDGADHRVCIAPGTRRRNKPAGTLMGRFTALGAHSSPAGPNLRPSPAPSMPPPPLRAWRDCCRAP